MNSLFKLSTLLLSSFLISKKRYYSQLYCKDYTTIYTRKQVQEHYNNDTRIWVTFQDGVYDITDFIKIHPGGEKKILMAAGGAIEPFWAMYSFHNEDAVKKLLYEYRIGTLQEKDRLKPSDIPDYSFMKNEDIDKRSKSLIKYLAFPYCGEPRETELSEYFYTPNDLFFVRNHNHIPEFNEYLNKSTYKLEFILPKENDDDEEEDPSFIISLNDLLKDFTKKSRTTIMACAGNRRNQLEYKGEKTKGIQWKCAIANGVWEGVLLRDLIDFYIRKTGRHDILKNIDSYHLIANGNDTDFQNENYSISIPLKSAYEQGMLASEYNGSEIPIDHGYPLRLVIPGFVGVRNVKWVKTLKISKEESQGNYQQKDYKIIKEHSFENVDLSKLKPVNTWEVNSAILNPCDNSNIIKDNIDDLEIKGWAIGSNGVDIFKIELSFDEGKTWTQVDNTLSEENEDGKVHGWTLWKHKINKEQIKNINNLSILVKATDLLGNEQKKTIDEAWNFRGIMNNSYHKIKINLI